MRWERDVATLEYVGQVANLMPLSFVPQEFWGSWVAQDGLYQGTASSRAGQSELTEPSRDRKGSGRVSGHGFQPCRSERPTNMGL